MDKIDLDCLENFNGVIECAVCFRKFKTTYVCISGHNLCEICWSIMHECPVCVNDFSAAHNYCVDNIFPTHDEHQQAVDEITKFIEEIRLSENKELDKTNKYLLELGTAINRSWGLFPCVVNKCFFKGCFDQVVHHFENEHPNMYERIFDSTLPMIKSWKVAYKKQPTLIHRGFFIENIGFFIFHIRVNNLGYLQATILMYASCSVAKKFSYHLEVTNGTRVWNKNTRKILTCRTPLGNVYRKSLSLHPEQILGDSNNHASLLTCSITLKQKYLR